MRATAGHVASIILWLFAVTLGLSTTLAQAETYRYQYIPFSQAKLPPGYGDFYPIVINDGAAVYGAAAIYDDSPYNPFPLAVYKNGVVTLLSDDYPYSNFYPVAGNESGTVGGFETDTSDYHTQAALFHGRHEELIPILPGDTNSQVVDLNDDGTALVVSWDADNNDTSSLYKKGKSTLLNFGLKPTGADVSVFGINNEGTIIGVANSVGFRHDPSTGKTIMLNPLPTEQHSWVVDINNKGNVAGYSYNNPNEKKRIGLWDKKGIFHTYFIEGTPGFPTNSENLLFNDKNLIVITDASSNCYLVPKPGVGLNLADLVVNTPFLNWKPAYIKDINNEGDMIGYGSDFSWFLLKRIDAKTRVPAAVR
ncbi:MAG: hypothetical protein ABL933_19240 [Methyloglobulus sp.]